MKERPILFNAEMVKAILAGNKTQTRRVMKTQIVFGDAIEGFPPLWHLPTGPESGIIYPNGKDQIHAMCPLGKVGDRLWLREAFGEVYDWCDHPEMPGCPTERWHIGWKYRADGEVNREELDGAFTGWKPSIHMPRTASRITLEITAVRVERVNKISNSDARAEGVCGVEWGGGFDYGGDANYRDPFKNLWESIYGTERWATNPWVWVIEFKRIEL